MYLCTSQFSPFSLSYSVSHLNVFAILREFPDSFSPPHFLYPFYLCCFFVFLSKLLFSCLFLSTSDIALEYFCFLSFNLSLISSDHIPLSLSLSIFLSLSLTHPHTHNFCMCFFSLKNISLFLQNVKKFSLSFSYSPKYFLVNFLCLAQGFAFSVYLKTHIFSLYIFLPLSRFVAFAIKYVLSSSFVYLFMSLWRILNMTSNILYFFIFQGISLSPLKLSISILMTLSLYFYIKLHPPSISLSLSLNLSKHFLPPSFCMFISKVSFFKFM